MAWSRRSPFVVMGALFVLAAVARCQSATQMVIDVTTDVPCGQSPTTTVVVGRLGALAQAAPSTLSTSCVDGKIGVLVVVPSGSDDDALAFEVSTGIGVDPSSGACGDGTSPQCIVARRSLRFIPHESVRVHVPMRLACAGHPCDPQSTCKNASCVPATIDDPSRCTGDGCGEEALGAGTAVSDGGADADASSAPADARSDANPSGTQVELALGDTYSCALVKGAVWCWGTGSALGLGAGVTETLKPMQVTGLSNIAAIGAGYGNTVVAHAAGDVLVWGQNSSDQIPSGGAGTSVPVAVANLTNITRVCVGRSHLCALDKPGTTLSCWGDLDRVGTLKPPMPFPLPKPADTIHCGEYVTTVRLTDGTVMSSGQAQAALGRPGGADGTAPVLVDGVSGALALASGYTDSIVTTATGHIVWGANVLGQLDVTSGAVPVGPAPQLDAFDRFSLGDHFACGIKAGSVYCWGENSDGQLGYAPTTSGPPAKIPTLPGTAVKVWTGVSHACASFQDGRIFCWGDNTKGQLGNGNKTSTPTPQQLHIGTFL